MWLGAVFEIGRSEKAPGKIYIPSFPRRDKLWYLARIFMNFQRNWMCYHIIKTFIGKGEIRWQKLENSTNFVSLERSNMIFVGKVRLRFHGNQWCQHGCQHQELHAVSISLKSSTYIKVESLLMNTRLIQFVEQNQIYIYIQNFANSAQSLNINKVFHCNDRQQL